jgi:hypothetical protein
MIDSKFQKWLGTALLGAVVVTTLAGCATGSPASGETVRDTSFSSSNDCIVGSSVRDYTALDDRNLLLYGPGNRAYHVVLVRPAFDLESEFRIGVYDADAGFGGIGRICPYGGDAIIIEGPITERIAIRSIQALDDTAVVDLKVRFGKMEPADDDALTVTDLE